MAAMLIEAFAVELPLTIVSVPARWIVVLCPAEFPARLMKVSLLPVVAAGNV